MKNKILSFLIPLLTTSLGYAQPYSNGNLPFENKEITIEKVIAGIVVLAVYLIPTIIARDKKKWRYILVFNLLTAWTIIGWMIALVWSLNAQRKPTENTKPI